MNHRLFALWSIVLALGILATVGSSSFQADQERPQCAPVATQPLAGGKTFVTWVPSEAAPDGGIVVRVLYPDRPRYPEGTAAVVEVPGGDSSGRVDLPQKAFTDPFVAQGLIQVKFAFPGGGRPPLQSGGAYDHRGLDSLKAVRDVVRFLLGGLSEQNGCSIDDLLPYPVTQIGLVGPSNGGNTAIVTLGLFGEGMTVDWYVGWENPAGMQFATVDIGSREKPNPAYIPGSCRLTLNGTQCDVDYTRLRWDPEAVQQGHPPHDRGGRGVLYHDLNANGRYDESDYALGTYIGIFAGDERLVYSLPALEAAIERDLLNPWPEDVATLEETREYWRIRDMSRYYGDVIAKLPHLRTIVIGSRQDHVQGTPDYPHIVLQYQGWQEAGIPWVRLNPDAAYVQAVTGRALPVVDNDANMIVNYDNIASLVEPEVVRDEDLRLAAALELSDRTYHDLWSANVENTLRSAVLAREARQDDNFALSTQDGVRLALSQEGSIASLSIDGFELVERRAPALWIRDLSHANETDQPNLVENPGLESGLTGWRQLINNRLNIQITQAQTHGGGRALEFSSESEQTGFAAYASEPIPIALGKRYRVSAWWRSKEGYLSTLSGTPPNLCMDLYRESRRVSGLYLQWLDGRGRPLGNPELAVALHMNAANWRIIQREVTAPSDARSVQVIVAAKLQNETLWVDDIKLIASPEPEKAVTGAVRQEGDRLIQTAQLNDSEIQVTYEAHEEFIAVRGEVRNLGVEDRVFTLTFALPVATEGWRFRHRQRGCEIVRHSTSSSIASTRSGAFAAPSPSRPNSIPESTIQTCRSMTTPALSRASSSPHVRLRS